MVFVVDTSGSMEGEPLEQAKAAMEAALAGMDPADSFQIVDFSENASLMSARPLDATRGNVRRGLARVRGLVAGGGTMMNEGVLAALDSPRDRQRTRYVCFLTDGFIGNEAEVLGTLRDHLGGARVFSMGIGSAPNRYLLEAMARLGQGVAGYVGPGDDAAEVMGLFLERVSHPALADLSIDWNGLGVSEVYPNELPDLFVGRPVMVTGRFDPKRSPGATIRVTGRAGGERLPILVPVEMGNTAGSENGSLASLWARRRIEALSDRFVERESERTVERIRETALEFGLVSAYTSFVAVDSLTRTTGPAGRTVEVAVPVPEGTRYETTVGETSPVRPTRRPGDDGP
jgi:Ca-activated chloride channel family protein